MNLEDAIYYVFRVGPPLQTQNIVQMFNHVSEAEVRRVVWTLVEKGKLKLTTDWKLTPA